MTEERITETETPDGRTHTTHTTVINDGERRGGGGATWLILLVVLVLAAVAIWFFTQQSNSEIAANNAVENAANDVGAAATQAGEARRIVEDLLDSNDLGPEQMAEAYLTAYRISGQVDEESRILALSLYEQLYAETPKFVYNFYLSMLRERGESTD